jgi:hypothetical protein
MTVFKFSTKIRMYVDRKKETWLTYMAIITVLIAIVATLSTFKGGGYSTRSILNQTKAS